MSRAELEREAEGKYPKNIVLIGVFGEEHDDAAAERAAYIRGRLDQAEADARIAEKAGQRPEVVPIFDTARRHALIKGTEIATDAIAAAIREAVE